MGGEVAWLFGRGLSIDCGLHWSEPGDWKSLPRQDRIKKIKAELRAEMDAPGVSTQGICRFLEFLGDRTFPGWSHLFITTNWDYLLQREVDRMFPEEVPRWLRPGSHIYHLNGTVEVLGDNSRRSPFLLEDDPDEQRNQTQEGNEAFNLMTWRSVFVVVGMSFECETDKFLLSHLNQVQDDLPIGRSLWIIVNPCRSALDRVSFRIQRALPRAAVSPVCNTFSRWYETGFLGLETARIFSR
jgi:hypothetical protein